MVEGFLQRRTLNQVLKEMTLIKDREELGKGRIHLS